MSHHQQMKTIGYTSVDSIFLVVHADVKPSDVEWNAMISYAQAMVANPKGLSAVLVHTHATGPTSEQRAKLVAAVAFQKVPTAVLSSSAIVRGITTTLSWMGSNIRSFMPAKLDDALAYLSVPAIARRRVLATLAKLKVEVAGGAPLDTDEATQGKAAAEQMAVIVARLSTLLDKAKASK